jgi:hypothetical protein
MRAFIQTEVLDVEVLLEPVLRALAAEAAFLDAAERRDFGRDDSLVDADDAAFQCLGDTPHAGDVAAIEIARESELGGVGELQDFGLGCKFHQRRDRAERLLAHREHVGLDVREHRRDVEVSGAVAALAAGDDLRALRDGVAHVLFDLCDSFGLDQRPDLRVLVEPVPDAQARGDFSEPRCEAVIDAALHVDAIRAHTRLPGVAVLRRDRADNGRFQIRIVEHYERRIAAQLE